MSYYSFELSETSPSLNQWQRWHWKTRHAYSKRMAWVVLAMTMRKFPPAQGKRKVIVTRKSSRMLDYDNLVGGCKSIIDALVKASQLKDDSPEHAELVFQQARGSGMLIEILEISTADLDAHNAQKEPQEDG